MLGRRVRIALYSSAMAALYCCTLMIAALPALYFVRCYPIVLVGLPIVSFAALARWLWPRYDALFMLLDAANEGRPPLERQSVSNEVWGFEGLGISGALLGHYVMISVIFAGGSVLIMMAAVAKRSPVAFLFGLGFGAWMLSATRPRLTPDERAVVLALRELVAYPDDRHARLGRAIEALDLLLMHRGVGAPRHAPEAGSHKV